ncbi:MAG TPA: cupin-like domain-containing protein, partial [Rheinheimera sp.]|nr:cupin-like domain-containing protein [Rheinheimera sp.]
MAAVAEYFDVDKSQFWQQIIPSHQPAILRQAVKHWPSVVAAGKS